MNGPLRTQPANHGVGKLGGSCRILSSQEAHGQLVARESVIECQKPDSTFVAHLDEELRAPISPSEVLDASSSAILVLSDAVIDKCHLAISRDRLQLVNELRQAVGGPNTDLNRPKRGRLRAGNAKNASEACGDRQ